MTWRRAILGLGAILLLASLGAAAPSPAMGEPLPQAVAAVVDFQRLMNESSAARSINEQIETRRKGYLEQLAREEQRLYEVERELAKQRSVLAPEAFAEKRRAFEAQVQEAQRLSQEKRRELEAARNAAIGQVREAVIGIVSDLADTHGFNLVLPTSAVVMFAPSIDLTDEILEELNQRLPDVRIPPNAG